MHIIACIFFVNERQSNIIRIFSPSGTGSDLLFIWTVSAHRKTAPVGMTGAVPVMYSPAGASTPQTPPALPGGHRNPGVPGVKPGPLPLSQS